MTRAAARAPALVLATLAAACGEPIEPPASSASRTHIEQLMYLFRITGDEYFRETLYDLAEDTGYQVPDWWWSAGGGAASEDRVGDGG